MCQFLAAAAATYVFIGFSTCPVRENRTAFYYETIKQNIT